MEMHNIDLPNKKNERKYCPEGLEPVYLAVSGDIVAMFVVGMTANPEMPLNAEDTSVKRHNCACSYYRFSCNGRKPCGYIRA